jgi:hypothetical protein
VKKRFGFLSLFAITALLLTSVGAITALAAPATGTVTLDANFYTIGGSVKATVTDADPNASTPRTDQDIDMNGTAAGLAKRVILANTPVIGSPQVVTADGTTEIATMSVLVVEASLGIVDIITSQAVTVATLVDVIYSTSAADSVNVTFTSTQDPVGITVAAAETGNDTGIFTATITLVDAATTASSSTALTLKTLNLDTVKVEYSDATPTGGSATAVKVSDTASVETSKPTFSGLAPADDFSTQSGQPTLTGTISDVGGAGIDVSEVKIYMGGTATVPTTISGSDGDTSVSYSHIYTLLVGAYVWYVSATDMAGNTGRTDASTTSAGDQDFDLSIDTSPPVLSSANTGKYWDTSLTTAAEGSNKLSSVSAVFNEKLDSNTVAAEDFLVEGVAPILAEVHGTAGTTVYLTLASDLAANAKPVVKIADSGSIADTAGNSLNVGTKTSVDTIAPSFTVSTDVTLTKKNVVVSISSDEPIAGVPSVAIYNAAAGLDVTLTVVVKTSTSWEATYTNIGDDGKKSVYVSATDLASPANTGTKGKTDPATSGAITFTLDTTAPTITFDPLDAADVFKTSPFVTLTYSEKVEVTKVEFGVKGTTLSDILATGNLQADGKSWTYSATGLVVGSEYTIKGTASDLAGNELKDQSATFEVKAVPDVKIALQPGMNLISLPSEPADSSINSVITLTEVVSVITYDPLNPDPVTGSPWLTATRDAAGNLTGSLTSIDASRAYWVETTSFAPISVGIPDQGFNVLPPFIQVVGGWNLVPVVSIEGDAPGSTISADTYFGSTKWVTAYTFNTQTGTWTKILPKSFKDVVVGAGYWLYVTEDGILVP